MMRTKELHEQAFLAGDIRAKCNPSRLLQNGAEGTEKDLSTVKELHRKATVCKQRGSFMNEHRNLDSMAS